MTPWANTVTPDPSQQLLPPHVLTTQFQIRDNYRAHSSGIESAFRYSLSQAKIGTLVEGSMTTKLAFWIAVIVPGGFFILAALILLRSMWAQSKSAQPAMPGAAR